MGGGTPWSLGCLASSKGSKAYLREDHFSGGRPAALLENLAPGATLIADRACDTDAIRNLAAERGAWANIPPRSIRKGSFAFSTWVYRQRNLVERFFNRVKQFRGLTTRYDRRPENYLAGLKLVIVRIWLAAI